MARRSASDNTRKVYSTHGRTHLRFNGQVAYGPSKKVESAFEAGDEVQVTQETKGKVTVTKGKVSETWIKLAI